MKKNIGTTDRIIRLLVAIIAGVLYFTNVITGTRAIVILIVGFASLLTSITRFCGLYTLLGISTCPLKKKK